MISERDVITQCVCHKAKLASRAISRHYDDALRPTGLRSGQLAILVAVALDATLSISALAAALGMDRSTLTRNLRPLERDRLVELGPEGWRRSRALRLTRKGRAALDKALPVWAKAQQALKRRLGEADWHAAHGGLDRLIQAA